MDSTQATAAPPAELRGLFESAGPAFRTGACAGLESRQRMNLAGIDFVSVRLAVLCAETSSLSAAARHLHMSLSCASHRLSTLEGMFDTRFFERDHRGLHATPAGTVFVTHARPILDLLRWCRMQVDTMHDATPDHAGRRGPAGDGG